MGWVLGLGSERLFCIAKHNISNELTLLRSRSLQIKIFCFTLLGINIESAWSPLLRYKLYFSLIPVSLNLKLRKEASYSLTYQYNTIIRQLDNMQEADNFSFFDLNILIWAVAYIYFVMI